MVNKHCSVIITFNPSFPVFSNLLHASQRCVGEYDGLLSLEITLFTVDYAAERCPWQPSSPGCLSADIFFFSEGRTESI